MSWLSKLGIKKPSDRSHLLKSQLAKFSQQSLRSTPVCTLDLDAIDQLFTGSVPEMIALDIGGTKLSTAQYVVKNGAMSNTNQQKEKSEEEYLAFLEKVAKVAAERSVSVSISFAGPVNGTKPLAGPNVPSLFSGLESKYQGDFASLFPTLKSLSNDAVAGLAAGAVAAKKRFPQIKNVLYLINGSGIGGAVLKDKTIFAIEPGHVEIVPELNIFDQRKPCGMLGAEHICVESVAAGKAGIGDAWYRKKQQVADGEYIAQKMRGGDQFARSLYDHSALMVAYIIKGIYDVFAMDVSETAVVFHGGVFAVEGYAERIRKVIQSEMNTLPPILLTSEFSHNACLDGAAILGWLA